MAGNTNKPTAAELFAQAARALEEEQCAQLRPVFKVEFNCVHPNVAANNYNVVLLVTIEGQIVRQPMFTNYTHLDLPGMTVANGFMHSSKVVNFPLVNNFNRQFELGGYLITVTVTSVLVERQ
eukprot:TRINITY_DN330_c2_g1_i2.p2 TRINITY_DN330_c2_g1~~TRINITY_DN330_c2_g1_i2.p2  ORF type:complete len:138 (-),score=41.52 TRINITY_DN330_c2_g1_i2:109-477(-)